MKAELAWKTEAFLGEGSLWDGEGQRLLWVNITDGEIHAFHPAEDRDELLFKTNEPVGTVVQRQGGGLVAALRHGLAFIDEATGTAEFICSPEDDRPANRFNDGKCDMAGRFWAGTMDHTTRRQGAGSLYCLDTDRTCRKVLDNVTTSNGLAWTDDMMYYTDTRTRVIWAFDYDKETGAISNRRTVVEIAQGQGGPDGFTLDAEGRLWVAQWNGWQVACYDPHTGKKLETVEVPAAHVSSCAFGGANLEELYITTAREGLTAAELESQPLAGSLFVARVGVKGIKAYKYKG